MIKLDDYKGTPIEKSFQETDIEKAWSDAARAAAKLKRKAASFKPGDKLRTRTGEVETVDSVREGAVHGQESGNWHHPDNIEHHTEMSESDKKLYSDAYKNRRARIDELKSQGKDASFHEKTLAALRSNIYEASHYDIAKPEKVKKK